jgi:hypothetical protein
MLLWTTLLLCELCLQITTCFPVGLDPQSFTTRKTASKPRKAASNLQTPVNADTEAAWSADGSSNKSDVKKEQEVIVQGDDRSNFSRSKFIGLATVKVTDNITFEERNDNGFKDNGSRERTDTSLPISELQADKNGDDKKDGGNKIIPGFGLNTTLRPDLANSILNLSRVRDVNDDNDDSNKHVSGFDDTENGDSSFRADLRDSISLQPGLKVEKEEEEDNANNELSNELNYDNNNDADELSGKKNSSEFHFYDGNTSSLEYFDPAANLPKTPLRFTEPPAGNRSFSHHQEPATRPTFLSRFAASSAGGGEREVPWSTVLMCISCFVMLILAGAAVTLKRELSPNTETVEQRMHRELHLRRMLSPPV